ncbi:43104_t:CDS:2, partial [Gigaspora margarita]
MNPQIEILKIQKRKLIKQDDFLKKKPKTFIESKMNESANKVKNVHFLTSVLNYINNPCTFFFVSLVLNYGNELLNLMIFGKTYDSFEFDPPNPQSRKYKTYYSIFLKNLDILQDYCLDRWNFYKPTSIFKTKVNYNFCEYLVNKLEPLVDSSVVEVIRNLYKILNEKDLYIEKYRGIVKNYDFPKNLQYNRDFNYNSDDEIGYFY